MGGADPQYDWWRAALRGECGPIDVNEPQSGFYRLRRKMWKQNGIWASRVAAFWRKDGILHCRLNLLMLPELETLELWPFAAKRPISYDDYATFIEFIKGTAI